LLKLNCETNLSSFAYVNYAQSCSCNQPVLSNEGKVSGWSK